jgi:hypothetical protein
MIEMHGLNLPKWQGVVVSPRQAYSHSASLGKRYSRLVSKLSRAQNSWASG